MCMKLILASSSPMRNELLKKLGYPFKVVPSKIDEKLFCIKDPTELAKKLALEKARDVAIKVDDGIVIGADTIGVVDGEVLGKPRDEQDARRMLKKLGGQTHKVITGLALIDAKTHREKVVKVETDVTFRKLTDNEIDEYIETGEPLKKAAAYGIMEGAASFASRIDGCFYNVVGLPLAMLAQLLKEFSKE